METLKDWLENKDLSEAEEKKVSKMLDVKIQHEFRLHEEDMWISWQAFGSHKHVMSWVLLENKYAVGFNENPGKGWSFPVEKVPSEVLVRYINKKLEFNREAIHIKSTLDVLKDWVEGNSEDKKLEIPFQGKDRSLEELIYEVENKTILGNEFRKALDQKTIDLLNKNIKKAE
ncbi:MAG TPA: hypothetical protein VMZ91_01390 [Candidatus Paceibacterota bacterium]|nr:hypothetical protein [Candidatus Paceibacterota bacterium]